LSEISLKLNNGSLVEKIEKIEIILNYQQNV